MNDSGAGTGQYAEYLERYRRGEWRAPIVHDLIAGDIRSAGPSATVLDIGCGRGFDDELSLQKSLAALANRYIGVEPDTEVALATEFSEVYRCAFEQAPIKAGSIDVAFAIMVLEHVADAQLFLAKVHQILKPGGVFWGMTVDRRSLFAKASYWLERLQGKELYMRWLMGRRGEERYLNYPVFYRCNSPAQIERHAGSFARREIINFARIGQHRPIVPSWLHGLSDRLDRWVIDHDKPGTLLLLRLVK
jgi:SAM-dependent methyltransferase